MMRSASTSRVATRRWSCFLALLCWCAFASADELTLPARGLVDLEEGTIEAQIWFAFDPNAPAEKFKYHGTAWTYDYGDAAFADDMLSLSVYTVNGSKTAEPRMQPRLRFGGVFENRKLRHPTAVPYAMEANRWHHVAIAWTDGGRRIWVYIDGKAHADSMEPRWVRAVTNRAALHLGKKPPIWEPSCLALDNLRISSVALSAEQLASDGDPSIDRHTTLVMTFDESAEEGTVRPTFAATAAGRAATALPGRMRLVVGPWGRCLALSAEVGK